MSAEAAEIEAKLEGIDTFALVRNLLRKVSQRDCEYAGIPMPLRDETLVVEPSYPMPEQVVEILGGKMRRTDWEPTGGDIKPRNVFWSSFYRKEIVVWDSGDGKVAFGIHRGNHKTTMMLHTMGCADAWGWEQEANAIALLGELVTARQLKHYMMTGQFLETSKRSGVTYAFRRLRPTVAMSARGEQMQILCTLCLHPIAYYAGTHAGAMCPTDDVIAALMLMRGDEHMFWRRANQHPAIRPESAL